MADAASNCFEVIILLKLGTRMWRRGANLEGDTANFIETEQLLEFEGFMSSFLQVFFWDRWFLRIISSVNLFSH